MVYSAFRDENSVPVAIGVSTASATTVLPFKVSSITGRLLTDAASGSGTVTDVSVVSANGFAGTVATSTTTPAITLTTTINAPVLKGTGTAIAAASTTGSGTSVVLGTSPTITTSLLLSTGFNITGAGAITMAAGGDGETFTLTTANGTTLNSTGGDFQITLGNATSGVARGGDFEATSGNGFGAADGGSSGLVAGDAGSGGAQGGEAYIFGGASTGTHTGGRVLLQGGNGGVTNGVGGYAILNGGTGGGTTSLGGPALVTGGNAPAGALGTAGHVFIAPGNPNTGTLGGIYLSKDSTQIGATDGVPVQGAKLVVSGITGVKTFTFPDSNGTIALTTGAANITVGVSTITSGNDTRILYNNAGTLGQYTIAGSGTVVAMATAPTFVTSITTPSVLATANDSGALGASGTAFADLFLASGGVINWSAANVTLTHSSGILTQNNGELRITSANVGTNADSVPTLSSTSTMTNKTLTSPVIGGAATFASDGSVKLTAAPADGHYSGITIAGDLGETVAFGHLVYLKTSDTQWYKADADAVTTAGNVLIGMCVLAGNDNDPSVILLHGTIQAASLFPTFTVGLAVYASGTAGELLVTPPAGADKVWRVVGFGLTGDILYFNPSQDHQTTLA